MNIASVIAFAVATQKGDPMNTLLEQIQVIANFGIVNDRYGCNLGSYSASTKPNVDAIALQKTERDIVRDITLISLEGIFAARRFSGINWEFVDTRRNILTLGIPDLKILIGKYFLVGDVLMIGTQDCAPCDRPSKLSNKWGFKQSFEEVAGIRAMVVTNGTIRLGDQLKKLS